MVRRTARFARKAAIGIVGVLVVIVGIVLIPLPGPGTLIIFAGLTILATEFDGARRLLDRAKDRVKQALGMKGAEPAEDADSA